MNDKPLEVGEWGVIVYAAPCYLHLIGLPAFITHTHFSAKSYYAFTIPGLQAPYPPWEANITSIRRLTDPDANQSQSTDQDIPVKA